MSLALFNLVLVYLSNIPEAEELHMALRDAMDHALPPAGRAFEVTPPAGKE